VQRIVVLGESGVGEMRVVLAVIIALGALGCGDELPGDPKIVCTAIATAGLGVEVKNETTSEPVCDATVTARDGAYSERLVAVPCRYVGAFERPGTYTVRVEKDGYAPKEVERVQVVMDNGLCPHVEETSLTILLVPQVASR